MTESKIGRAIKKNLKTLYRSLPYKKQVFLLLRRFWSPPHSIYQHLYFDGIIDIHVSSDRSFKVEHFGQQIENELFWCGLNGGWEKESINLWKKLCEDANVILDVGANSGLYSLVAKTASPQSQVYAFEPVGRVYKRLVRNNEINNFDIHAEEVALSNFDGEGIIYDTTDAHILSVTVNKNLHSPGVQAHPVTINVRKLSSFASQHHIDNIDLMKIDVETHEPEVLEGMGELLYKFTPTLLIEVLDNEVGARIQSRVENLNYLYFDIDEESGIRQVERIQKSSYFNYLLCQPDKAKKLGLIK